MPARAVTFHAPGATDASVAAAATCPTLAGMTTSRPPAGPGRGRPSPAAPGGESFTCRACGRAFTVPDATRARYPGWTPQRCLSCRDAAGGAGTTRVSPSPGSAGSPARGSRPGRGAAGRGSRPGRGAREEDLTVAQVLQRYTAGPRTGVFTDGAADPNPGPGGWGAVRVADDTVVDEALGHEPHTTNNRMELTALVAGYRMVPPDAAVTVYSDSRLCVQTITEWAPGWEARGWRRKGGPIANLDLVQQLYAMHRERPGLRLEWIRAHDGSRWNEYADALATAYRRAVR